MPTIDKQQFKITIAIAVSVAIFIIMSTFFLTSWKSQMENRIDHVDTRQAHLAEKYVDMDAKISSLEIAGSDRDIELAKINTKLANIEALLIEIKADLHEK